MSDRAHSPGPFFLRSFAPKGEDRGGHIICDAFGDSVGSLAWRTGDHPVEEQLANARLFTAAPDLLSNAKLVLGLRPRNWRSDHVKAAFWLALEASVAKAEQGE